jgi:hypothetical protein
MKDYLLLGIVALLAIGNIQNNVLIEDASYHGRDHSTWTYYGTGTMNDNGVYPMCTPYNFGYWAIDECLTCTTMQVDFVLPMTEDQYSYWCVETVNE